MRDVMSHFYNFSNASLEFIQYLVSLPFIDRFVGGVFTCERALIKRGKSCSSSIKLRSSVIIAFYGSL